MKLGIYLSVFFLAPFVAAAGEVRLSVDQAVSMALTNNLDAQAAAYRIAEARARVMQAGRLANPELESEIEPNVRGREYAWRVGFSQRFPVTARLRLEKQVSRAQVKVAEAELNDFRRKLALEVRMAAVSVAALDELIRLNERQVENSRAIAKVYVDAAKVGEASGIESSQLELAADQLSLQRTQLETQRNEASTGLAALIGVTEAVVITAGLPAPDGEQESAGVGEVVFEGSQRRVEAAREAVKLSRTMRWEDIGIGVFAGMDRREDLPEGLKTDHSVGVRVSVPLPLWNNRKGHVAEAEATAARVEKEAEALRRQIETEVVIAREQMAAATRSAAAVRNELLPKARELEGRLSQLHREGQAEFADMLRARERMIELEAAEVNARRDYHIARSRFLAATGMILKATP